MKILLVFFITIGLCFGQDQISVSLKRSIPSRDIGGTISPAIFEDVPEFLKGYPSFISSDSMWCSRLVLDREQYWYYRKNYEEKPDQYFKERIIQHKIDTLELFQNPSKKGFVYIFIGISKGKKYVIIDTNNNYSFDDDNMDVFSYPLHGSIDYIENPHNYRTHKIEFNRVIDKQEYPSFEFIRVLPQASQYNFKDSLSSLAMIYIQKATIFQNEFNYLDEVYEVIMFRKNVVLGLKEDFTNVQFLLQKKGQKINWDYLFQSENNFKLDNSIFKIKYLDSIKEEIVLEVKSQTPKNEGWQVESYLPHNFLDQEQALNNKNKKFTVLNFWGSWCGPCIKEIPELKKFQNEFSDLVNLQNFSVERNPSAITKAKEIVEKNEMNWDQNYLLFEQENGLDDILNVTNFPMLIAIDSNGKILAREYGLGNIEKVKKILGL